MLHIRQTLEQLLRYIEASADRAELEEVEALLGVALQEVRAKLTKKPRQSPEGERAE